MAGPFSVDETASIDAPPRPFGKSDDVEHSARVQVEPATTAIMDAEINFRHIITYNGQFLRQVFQID
jgi:hypothetical protein